MLSGSHDKRNALSQIHMQDNREHIAHSLSQPPTAHQTYAQYDSPAAEHSSNKKPKSPTHKPNPPNIPYPLTQQNNGRQSIEKGTEKQRITITLLPKNGTTG
jgi:hypothetical protein